MRELTFFDLVTKLERVNLLKVLQNTQPAIIAFSIRSLQHYYYVYIRDLLFDLDENLYRNVKKFELGNSRIPMSTIEKAQDDIVEIAKKMKIIEEPNERLKFLY